VAEREVPDLGGQVLPQDGAVRGGPGSGIIEAMNLARHRSGPGVGRASTAAAVTISLLAAALPMASPAGAATVPATGVTLVQVTSHQALPPPYKPGDVFLKTEASLAEFAGTLRADHVGTHLPPTSSGGCTGGTRYTVEVSYKTGHKVFLDAYECGGSVTGNMTGDVKAFVKYLSNLAS
jgi:hypothetical protein